MATPTYTSNIPIQELNVRAFYTKDYNMLPQNKAKFGLQGGVIMVKPNITTRDEVVGMVKSGNFYPGQDSNSGWFQSGCGMHIWGAMSIQGLLSYYFTEVAPDTSVELNRCQFNQIAENPRRSSFDPRGKYPRGTPWAHINATYHDMECRHGRDQSCDDVQCQTWPLDKTFILHYTYCKSPFRCAEPLYNETYKDHQCYLMRKEWFRIRNIVSEERNEPLDGQFYPESFLGGCAEEGGYIPLVSPGILI